jgi:hypothetical protein
MCSSTSSAFELVELFAPRRLDLLGRVFAIKHVPAPRAQKTGLLHQPGVKVVLVSGVQRLVAGREVNAVFRSISARRGRL